MNREIFKTNFKNFFFFKKKQARSSIINSILINKRVLIHNGLTFKSLKIVKPMIGFKFGDFIQTRKMGKLIHLSKYKKRKKIAFSKKQIKRRRRKNELIIRRKNLRRRNHTKMHQGRIL